MPKPESSESDNAGRPQSKAHRALQPQDAEPATQRTDSGEHAQHSRKKQKSNKHSAGADRAAEVQAKATSYVEQLAAPDPDIAKTGTMAIAETRQKDYNLHMQAKPWADTGGCNFDPRNGALALAREQTKDSVFKDSAEARRLPGWQAPESAESSQRHQPPHKQLRSHKAADDSSGTASSQSSPSHNEDKTQDVEGVSSSGQEEAQQPQAEANAQTSHQHGPSHGGDDTRSREGKTSRGHEEAEQTQEGAQTSEHSQGSPGMSGEIEECNHQTDSKKAQKKDEGHGGHAAEASKATRDRLHHEQTHQHHPQNDSEDAKSLPPVVQALQKAQQRAHDEMEAAEKKSSDLRFPAEAGQRFVTNARKHKSKLDATVFEHGTNVRSSETQE